MPGYERYWDARWHNIYDLPPLKKFDISEKTGFLPQVPPLKRLPGECFSKWEDLLQCLPQLVKKKRLRDEVDKLPEVEFSEKNTPFRRMAESTCRAMLLYTQAARYIRNSQ